MVSWMSTTLISIELIWLINKIQVYKNTYATMTEIQYRSVLFKMTENMRSVTVHYD